MPFLVIISCASGGALLRPQGLLHTEVGSRTQLCSFNKVMAYAGWHLLLAQREEAELWNQPTNLPPFLLQAKS